MTREEKNRVIAALCDRAAAEGAPLMVGQQQESCSPEKEDESGIRRVDVDLPVGTLACHIWTIGDEVERAVSQRDRRSKRTWV